MMGSLLVLDACTSIIKVFYKPGQDEYTLTYSITNDDGISIISYLARNDFS